jgi:nicotinamidase-related amidase
MTLISSAQSAVVVVDVQVGLFCTNPAPFEAGAVIRRINSVTAKARAAFVPVIFVQNDGPPEGDWLVPYSHGWQLHPDLSKEPGELIIRKTTPDAFYGTTLEQTLRSRRIQSLVLLGYATDFCIDSTLRNAASKEFEVFVISDAHTTNDTPTLNASLIRRHFNWIWSDSSSSRGIHVLKADELIFGEPGEAKSVSHPAFQTRRDRT